MPYLWTSQDTQNAVLYSVIPAGLGVASLLSAQRGGLRHALHSGNSAAIPAWARQNPNLFAAIDVLTLSPLGYAAYLVYRDGGGFDYTDTTVAVSLFGASAVLAGAVGPLLKNRNYKCLAINNGLLAAAAAAVTYISYGINKQAPGYIAPFVIWTAINAVLGYQIYRLNSAK